MKIESLNDRNFAKRVGFTLVELLVTMAIIGTLVAILVPAVHAVREAGRRAHCQNNLRNIGVAMLRHHETFDAFPMGGWGHEWVGVPDRGSGKSQPGGWIYCILPYVEEEALHNLGSGSSGATADLLYSQRLMTPVPLFTCPSRRPSAVWPVSVDFPYVRTPRPFGKVDQVARADYAINSGTSQISSSPGPETLQEGDSEHFWDDQPPAKRFSGISHLRFAAKLSSIADGASFTYLVGEKHVNSAMYMTGESPGDNESMYSGYCTDLNRFAGIIENLTIGGSPFIPPLGDTHSPGNDSPDFLSFGSAHSSSFNMTYCDGSVRPVDYDVDAEIHFRAAHRRDRGEPLDKLK